MDLENRVFSDRRVASLQEKFVVVKADPRSSSFDRRTYQFKSTRYVPEIVLLSPDQRLLGRLDANATVESAQAALSAALETN